MTAPLCLSLFQLCQGQYDAVWRKLSAQRATADTAAELGCSISPHVSFRSARLRIGVMLRFLRCRDHAVTWCAGRESCRSLDGSRTAQTDQSRSNPFTRIASTAAWPMNRKAKTCAAALRRGSDSDSAIPGRQEPGKEEKDTGGSRIVSRKSRLCPFDFLALFSFPQNCGRWGDWQFSSLPKK